jgi:SAM-dependent methyltransferase
MTGDNSFTAIRQCPACASADGVEQGTKGSFQMLACRRCRTLYTSHLPTSQEAEDYDSYYHDDNLSAPAFVDERLDQIIAEFAPYRLDGRLLDVGFGAGLLMQAARRASWQVTGVEVSQSACQYVRGLGFEVSCGTLDEAGYETGSFDVVTASEVLEHVPDPQAVLNEIGRILRPGGLLWGTTPHSRGFSSRALGLKWSVVSPPEHLQLFSVKGIKRMLAEAGFRRVEVATQGVNPYEIIQTLRRGKRQLAAEGNQHSNERVESGYRLNESLMASPSRRVLKRALNGLLNLGSIGDSLKIWAEK